MANTHSLNLENGSSQYAQITNANQVGLGLTGDFTIEAWVKLESTPGPTYEICAKYSTSGLRAYRFFYTTTGGAQLRIAISNDGTSTEEIGGIAQTLTNGVWYHVAVAWTAATSTAEFFVNGSSIGSAVGAKTAIASTTAAFLVGQNGLGGNLYDGLIDELRVWNDVRTDQEITDNYDVELVGNEANLQGCWRFNNDYTDITANTNDLTAVNSPTFSADVAFVEASGFTPKHVSIVF